MLDKTAGFSPALDKNQKTAGLRSVPAVEGSEGTTKIVAKVLRQEARSGHNGGIRW